MRAAALAMVGALALAGCQTTKDATETDPKAVQPAPVDAKIHQVSAELANYCGTAKALLPLVGAFVGSKPAVQKVLASGQVAVGRFCEDPPDDLDEAVTTMSKIVADLIKVWRAEP